MSILPNGKATRNKSLFSLESAVGINIKASPDKIWKLLTNAQDFPRWNSTVQSIEGNIALGETIKLKVPYAADRVFKLRISDFNAPRMMIWQDGAAPMFKGVRTYTLTQKSDGTTDFTMAEVFSGLMMPMIAGSLPDMSPFFERYAVDLKKEAEKGS